MTRKQGKMPRQKQNNRYRSGKIILETAKSEYEVEIDRTKILDTKVGITLPIVVTYYFMILQDGRILEFWGESCNTECKGYMGFVAVMSFLYLSAIICDSLALYKLYKAIVSHTYKKIELDSFMDEASLAKPENEFAAGLAVSYAMALENNREVSGQRAELYDAGLRQVFLSVVFYVIYYILLYFGGLIL